MPGNQHENMKNLKKKPAPTTKNSNPFELRLKQFCFWPTGTSAEATQSLQFHVLYEYARESQLICSYVRSIKALEAGDVTGHEGGLSVKERAAQQRRMLADYVYPFSPELFLDGSFPRAEAVSKVESYLGKWQKRPFPALFKMLNDSVCPLLRRPRPGPRFDVIRPNKIAPNESGQLEVRASVPILPEGTDCLQWHGAPDRDELSDIRWQYDEELKFYEGDFSAQFAVCSEAEKVIDKMMKDSRMADCVAVLIKASDFPSCTNTHFCDEVLSAAKQALVCEFVSQPFASFPLRLTGHHDALHICARAAEAITVEGQLSGVRLILFPRASLDSDQILVTRDQFHGTVFQHGAWKPWGVKDPTPELLEWQKPTLLKHLNRLWAFRYIHSIPANSRPNFKREFDTWRSTLDVVGLEHFKCWNTPKHIEDCALKAKRSFEQLFPRARAAGDMMWRNANQVAVASPLKSSPKKVRRYRSYAYARKE
jgi:hypothetical protein